MPGVTAVTDYFFSGGDFSVAILSVRVAVLAARFDIELQMWMEDGLGVARGFFCRLPQGQVVLLRELDHAIAHLGAPGPDIIVAGDDLISFGAAACIAAVLDAFELLPGVVAWRLDPEEERHAAALVAHWKKRQQVLKPEADEPFDPC